MGKYQLGEFEEAVLLTIGVLYEDAYGVSIKLAIEEKMNRNVSVGALQSALKRLEEKGYVTSSEGETTSERGGRPKKYFAITDTGKRTIKYTHQIRNELYDQIPRVVLTLKGEL